MGRSPSPDEIFDLYEMYFEEDINYRKEMEEERKKLKQKWGKFKYRDDSVRNYILIEHTLKHKTTVVDPENSKFEGMVTN